MDNNSHHNNADDHVFFSALLNVQCKVATFGELAKIVEAFGKELQETKDGYSPQSEIDESKVMEFHVHMNNPNDTEDFVCLRGLIGGATAVIMQSLVTRDDVKDGENG